jgi:ERCC4-type nuclease
MSLTIDTRERSLIDALTRKSIPHDVRTLDVGDIICEGRWVAERKTAEDLARSIKSGRWREQQYRLSESGLFVAFIIEGDLRSTSMPYESTLGACVNAELRKAHVFRTWDIDETVHLIVHLFHKVGAPHGIASCVQPPVLTSKRQRDADTVSLRMLMCIPSVSENIAKALLEKFGTLPRLQLALRDLSDFPRVSIGERSLGQARLQTMRKYLVEE